jgi:IS4 transposase
MLATAGCVVLITSLPREAWAGSRILELYRRRWRVELVFKRLKSLIGLEELRVHDNELVRVWIHAVLLIALLIDAERPSLMRERPDSPPSANRAEDTCPSGGWSRCSALA